MTLAEWTNAVRELYQKYEYTSFVYLYEWTGAKARAYEKELRALLKLKPKGAFFDRVAIGGYDDFIREGKDDETLNDFLERKGKK